MYAPPTGTLFRPSHKFPAVLIVRILQQCPLHNQALAGRLHLAAASIRCVKIRWGAFRRGEGPLRSDAMRLRGGAGALGIPSFVDLAQMKPEKLFNTYLSVLAVTCAGVRLSSRDGYHPSNS